MLAVLVAAVALLVGSTTVGSQPTTSHGLRSITLKPAQVRRSIGDTQYLTANGTFADGRYRNITQRVEYRSSDPTVAVAKNERGHKSRIDLVGIGRATISAVDPLTGVTSTGSDGDVTVRVVGRVERITLQPTDVQRAIGESQHFTVIGHYAGGATRNLTQQSKYRSSDPTVALAPNLRGDKSRVEAVGAGRATIVAFHPLSGLSSDDSGTSATFTVFGPLEKIILAPVHPRRALGDVQHYTATGHYAGGAVRNLTQQVEYATSDSAVAIAPNTEGNRSRITTVAPGTVTISARDTATGISSRDVEGGDAMLTVYDPADPTRGLDATAAAPRTVCGDASADGALGLQDPLWILAGVIGVRECPLAVCDVDADGVVATADAVAVAWVVVGSDVILHCRSGVAP